MKFPHGSNPAARDTPGRDRPRRRIDRVALHLLDIERARELSFRLRLPVTIDASGWLSDQVEIWLQTQHDRTIWPLRLLVGPHATDLLELNRRAIHGQCTLYNVLIRRLRGLKAQVAALVRDDQIAEGSPLALAHAELASLESDILCQQYTKMGHNVVRRTILDAEVELLREDEARYSDIIMEHVQRRNALDRVPRVAGPV